VEAAGSDPEHLSDGEPVSLILRPDIEDRNFHEYTKAYTGPEHHFPSSVSPMKQGFRFHPHTDHQLDVYAQRSAFTAEAEWLYRVHRSQEAQRGQDPESDLFSPGYFSCSLRGGKGEILTAEARTQGDAMILPTLALEERIRSFFDPPLPTEPLAPA